MASVYSRNDPGPPKPPNCLRLADGRSIQVVMPVRQHFLVSGRALKRWFLAQCLDSAIVGLLWLVGLLLLGVPWAPLWAVFAALFQFIPQIGGALTLLGPLCAGLFEGTGWQGILELLCLYAVVMVLDGLLLQPMLFKRTTKVPIWASIVVPLIMGYFFQFWGILLSAPMLAIFYALKTHREEARQLAPPVQLIPPAVHRHRRTREAPPAIIEG